MLVGPLSVRPNANSKQPIEDQSYTVVPTLNNSMILKVSVSVRALLSRFISCCFFTIVRALVSDFAFFLFAMQSFPGASSYLQVL